ncbi:hypothetical protein [Streptomyces sp. NPDC002851]
MTQSGQGEEPQLPAARPAHEGVVLPADGGDPLMPGTYGTDGTVPAGGSPWGTPWGPQTAPGAEQPPQPAPGGYAQGEAWGQGAEGSAPAYPQQQPETPPYAQGQQQPGTPPYAQSQQPEMPAYPQAQQPESAPYPPQQQPETPPYAQAPQQQPEATPFPGPYAQQPESAPYQQQPDSAQLPPAGGAPSYLPEPQQRQESAPLPPQQHEYQQNQQHQPAPLPPQQPGGAPLPPVAPPVAAAADHGPNGAGPLPPEGADAEATQYMPPVPPQHPQHPQHAQNPESAHSRHPGALPPEAPAEATQFLGRLPGQAPQASTGAGSPDSEATQHIPPVPAPPPGAPYGIRPGAPGDRQPPAEFDSLFRSEPGDSGPSSTQQMPRFEEPPRQQYAPQDAGYDDDRRSSKKVLFAAAGAAIVVIGITAGALIGLSGGEDKKGGDETQSVSDSAPASESASPTADPAKEQAIALDKVLGDSNNSRQSVINAVKNIEACKNLGQAAADLRDAAKQRNGLVDRLSRLSVDQLPNSDRLTASLTKAWKSSASADNHFAAWADQVGGKKGCPKGKARNTPQRAAAIAASGSATTAKQEAARLWNAIAEKYSLTKHTPIQL